MLIIHWYIKRTGSNLYSRAFAWPQYLPWCSSHDTAAVVVVVDNAEAELDSVVVSVVCKNKCM